MNRKKRIEKILSKNFELWKVEIKDISSQHIGHNNFSGDDETHFSLILINNSKKYYNRLDIHKKINFLLKDEFSSGLHALEIKIKN